MTLTASYIPSVTTGPEPAGRSAPVVNILSETPKVSERETYFLPGMYAGRPESLFGSAVADRSSHRANPDSHGTAIAIAADVNCRLQPSLR